MKSRVEPASTSSSCAALMASLLGNGGRASGAQGGQVKCKLKRRRRRRSKRKGTTLPSFRTCRPSSVFLCSEQRSCAPWRLLARAKAVLLRSGSRGGSTVRPVFGNEMTINPENGRKWLPFGTSRRCDGTWMSWKVSCATAGFLGVIKRALSKNAR